MFVFLRGNNNAQDSRPEINNPESSRIPNLKAAEKPIIDQKSGIIIRRSEIFFVDQRNIPKVKMVVGQGKPKVGDDG